MMTFSLLEAGLIIGGLFGLLSVKNWLWSTFCKIVASAAFIGTVGSAACLGLLYTLIFLLDFPHQEITEKEYVELKKILEENPSINHLLVSYVQDGKITNNEYKKIKNDLEKFDKPEEILKKKLIGDIKLNNNTEFRPKIVGETDADGYYLCAAWSKEYPEIKNMVDKFKEDGNITESEFNAVRAVKEKIVFAATKSKMMEN